MLNRRSLFSLICIATIAINVVMPVLVVQAQPPSEKRGCIAYIGLDGNVWLINADSGSQKQLTWFEADKATDITWSPDGQKLAIATRYYTHISQKCNINHKCGLKLYIFSEKDALLKEIEVIKGDQDLESEYVVFDNLIWSPDGDKIAFTYRWGYERLQSFIVNPEHSEYGLQSVGQDVLVLGGSSWSSDSQQLTYTCLIEHEGKNVCVTNLQDTTKQFTLLDDPPDPIYNPQWSPDDQQILFAARDGLYVIDADGANQKELARGNNITTYAWSPNGEYITYATWKGETSSVWTMNTDGSQRIKLTGQAYGRISWLSWSFDSEELAFNLGSSVDIDFGVYEVGDRAEIYVVSRNGNDLRKISDGLNPTWQPNTTPIHPTIDVTSLIQEKQETINFLENPTIQFLSIPILAPGYNEDGAKTLVAHLQRQGAKYNDGELSAEERAAFERQVSAFIRLKYQEQAMQNLYEQYVATALETWGSALESVALLFEFLDTIEFLSDKLSLDEIPMIGERIDLTGKITERIAQSVLDAANDSFDMAGSMISDTEDRETFNIVRELIYTGLREELATQGIDLGTDDVLQLLQTLLEEVVVEVTLWRYVQGTQPALDRGVRIVEGAADRAFYETNVRGDDDARLQMYVVTDGARIRTDEVHNLRQELESGASFLKIMADIGDLATATGILAVPGQVASIGSRIIRGFVYLVPVLVKGNDTMSYVSGQNLEAERRAFDTTIPYPYSRFNPPNYQVTLAGYTVPPLSKIYRPYFTQQHHVLQQAHSDYQAIQQQLVEALQREDAEVVIDIIPQLIAVEKTLSGQLKVTRAPILATASNVHPEVHPEFEGQYYHLVANSRSFDEQTVLLYGRLIEVLLQPDNAKVRQAAVNQTDAVNKAIMEYQQGIEAVLPAVVEAPLSPMPIVSSYRVENTSIIATIVNASPTTAQGVEVTLESEEAVLVGDLAGGEQREVILNAPSPGLYMLEIRAQNASPSTKMISVREPFSMPTPAIVPITTEVLPTPTSLPTVATNLTVAIDGTAMAITPSPTETKKPSLASVNERRNFRSVASWGVGIAIVVVVVMFLYQRVRQQ